MNYTETTDFLFNSFPLYQNIGAGAYKEGLGNITDFCTILDNPQTRFAVIHVAGTNGKGSVSHMLASVLQSAGYRVGLFTSPHLVDFRERIRINGQPISEQEVVEFVALHGEKMKAMGLSFFEMTTAMCFDYFARQGVEIAVIETGLGGRLDATNIVTPLLSVITNIGLEHTHMLGDTIAKIAAEKAGIIKRERPVVIGEHHPESDPVFIATATKCESEIVFAQDEWYVTERTENVASTHYTLTSPNGKERDIELDLLGDYQRHNLVTVMAAVDKLSACSRFTITESAASQALRNVTRNTGLKGRWQILSQKPLIVCDTGHNPHGFKHVANQIARQRYNKLYVVLGMVNDKDFGSIMPMLPAGEYLFTQPSVARALPAEQLQQKAAEYGLSGRLAGSVTEAFEQAKRVATEDDMIFVGGSTFMVADLLQATEETEREHN
ncbi:MAG: bifunctional folylpolyglutamate synthase/dihydrofolate synthase [Tidjanibacter sp.]|nr:bifunctional folylpolyglutamate synthase/dihydrofolate synthase [Tidjanibacter sp.]